jgi:hypothetical protein
VKLTLNPKNRRVLNRRAFLTGAGTVAIGLPFLESLPERSAWAANSAPVFTFFIVAQNGQVNKGASGQTFFPANGGALTAADLAAGGANVATSVLSPHVANLLFLKNINYPQAGPQSCGHAEANVQTLTGMKPGASGNTAYAAGPSADTLIGTALGADPLALYAGRQKGAFIAERISFKGAGAGQVRAADGNPYTLYSKVVGLAGAAPAPAPTTPGTTMTPADMAAQELLRRRKSVNDLVRAELNDLKGMAVLSAADKMRLDQHFQAIRDVEVTMGNMGSMAPAGVTCSKTGLQDDQYTAYKSGYQFDGAHMEDIVKLHLQIMAVAFGCNYSRVATLQWGDGTDGTKYTVPSNATLGWTFHQLSHRIQSDSASGMNPTAEQAHHEIDQLRMQSFLAGLDAFKAHGLQDSAQIVWTNTLADGPSHSTHGVPMIVWGSGGGYLKQGQYIDTAGTANAKILNTLIAAATRDVATTAPAIAGGAGLYDAMKA